MYNTDGPTGQLVSGQPETGHINNGGRIVGTPARKLYDLHGHRAAMAQTWDRGNRGTAGTNPSANSDARADSDADAVAEDLVHRGRVVGRGALFEETVVLDRDPDEPEVWWFGHLIDGNLGKRGRLRHDRSNHETTLLTGHDGGVYATAALLVHQACDPTSVHPTYFIYDVATQRLDMKDCDCPET
jgi:hypothetical protein